MSYIHNFYADSPPSTVKLEIKKHFDVLTDQEAAYAHNISRAAFSGTRITLRQISQESESIFDLIIENGQLIGVERREKTGADPMNSKDESTAVDFIKAYWKEIVEKWVTFFVYRQAISNTKVNKKIK